MVRTLRKTTGKVLNALFNILGSRIEGTRFLDLYAGVGTVGIEALRRGALEVVFVEVDRKRASEIERTLSRKALTDRATVINSRVESFVTRYKGEAFGVIFLDPPYHQSNPASVLRLFSEDLLKEDTLVVLEHFHKLSLPEELNRLRLKRQYRYGDTVLSIYGL